jgi:hypothetical protein
MSALRGERLVRDRGRRILVVAAAVLSLLTGARAVVALDEVSPLPAPPSAEATRGSVVDLFRHSAGLTIVADRARAMHGAALVLDDPSGTWLTVYTHCSDHCENAPSWSSVVVAEGAVGHVPTIALTGDGRPRIAYFVSTGQAPGLHYTECDNDCLRAGQWHDVWVAETLSTNPAPRPHLPFAVSAAGSVAYAYDDATGLQLVSCISGCAGSEAWTLTPVAGPFIVAESLAFGPDESLQLTARYRQLDTESLVFLECPSNCLSAQAWSGLDGLWRATGEIVPQLVRTAAGGSRIAFYADDPATPTSERILGYVACDARCATQSSWLPPLLLPAAPNSADVGLTLVLDASDEPVLAYAAPATSAISRCTADCSTPAGRWETTPGLSGQDLDVAFPLTPPPSCEFAGWSFYTGPALTLVDDVPVTSLTASAAAYEGECPRPPETSTFDTVSFVHFGP